MRSDKLIIAVTGANKGIGYGIVRGLASRCPPCSLVYLTARNAVLGEEALKKVNAELGDKRTCDIVFHQLDIIDEESCKMFAEHLQSRHRNISVLINNAGFAYNRDATEPLNAQADRIIDINYYGTKLVSRYIVPLISDGGRLINIASTSGIMTTAGKTPNSIHAGIYKKGLVDKFRDRNLAETEIDDFVERYRRFAHAGTAELNGYPKPAYMVSKAALIALTMVQSRELSKRDLIVNACCPGYVGTDMNNYAGPLTIDQGANTPIWLATSDHIPNGKFIFEKKPMDWLI